jgi:hypothetical protein
MSNHGGPTNRPGEDTRDMRQVALGNPEEHKLEARTQKRGNRYLGAGSAVIALAITLEFALTDPDARIFRVIALAVALAVGATMIGVSLTERSGRDDRARQIAGNAIAYDRGLAAVKLLERQIVDQLEQHREVKEQLGIVMAELGALVGRLGALEQGQQMLVELLPEDAQRRYWAGFNDAIREGFQATGTDPARRRSVHLGLVQRGSSDS